MAMNKMGGEGGGGEDNMIGVQTAVGVGQKKLRYDE